MVCMKNSFPKAGFALLFALAACTNLLGQSTEELLEKAKILEKKLALEKHLSKLKAGGYLEISPKWTRPTDHAGE